MIETTARTWREADSAEPWVLAAMDQRVAERCDRLTEQGAVIHSGRTAGAGALIACQNIYRRVVAIEDLRPEDFERPAFAAFTEIVHDEASLAAHMMGAYQAPLPVQVVERRGNPIAGVLAGLGLGVLAMLGLAVAVDSDPPLPPQPVAEAPAPLPQVDAVVPSGATEPGPGAIIAEAQAEVARQMAAAGANVTPAPPVPDMSQPDAPPVSPETPAVPPAKSAEVLHGSGGGDTGLLDGLVRAVGGLL